MLEHTWSRRIAWAIALVMAAPAWADAPAQFNQCSACHTGQSGSLGPDLHNVVGRKAGTLPGYRYSQAMVQSGLTWTPDQLRDYLMDPQKVVPRNRMPLAPMARADADAVVHYLVTLN